MKEKLKKFQNLSLKEKKEVLNWRNHQEIRKWMLNKEEISLQKHLKFIDSLKENQIYIKVDELGVINFKIYQDYVEFGLHKNPLKQKVGNILLKTAIEYAFEKLQTQKIILYVFEDNIKAFHLYKKFGFKEIDKQQNIIKMELKNENRKI